MRSVFKKNLQRIGLSPSRNGRPPVSEGQKSRTPSAEKRKRESYREKMMRKYKLNADQFDEAKKSATQQEKDWAHYKKEQVLKIFEPKNTYVSKSAGSDVKHPKLARATKVQMKDGRTVEVEFGRMKEWYLYSLAPDKAFVDIRTQTNHEKELKPLRDQQKVKFGDKPGKMQAEYDQIKSVYEQPTGAGGGVDDDKAVSPDDREDETEEPDRNAQSQSEGSGNWSTITDSMLISNANTTDEKHSLFPEPWYAFSISRSQMGRGGLTYWMKKNGAEEEEFDDDPEGKYTVTAEKVIEAIEGGGKCKDSGVKEPEKDAARQMMIESLASVQGRYKKTCSRDIVYLNTLKGTIDFVARAPSEENVGKKSVNEEPAVDASGQITFSSTLTAFVFKGNHLRRQYVRRKLVKKFEEDRKDYTREAGGE